LFKDKKVIVTGGGRGLGLAIVKAFLEQEAKVGIITRSEKTAKALVELQAQLLTRKESNNPHIMVADATKKEEIQAAIDGFVQEFNGLDILVYCAGVLRQGFILEETEQDWDKIFDLHLKGALFAMQCAVPVMKENNQGAIINLSSLAGQIPRLKLAAYGSAKAALEQLTRIAALEFAPYGITVNAIAPGPVETDLLQQYKRDNPGALKKLIHGDLDSFHIGIPTRRISTEEEVAHGTLFLASEKSRNITGQVLKVDGGQSTL